MCDLTNSLNEYVLIKYNHKYTEFIKHIMSNPYVFAERSNSTPGRRQSKTLILSTYLDQKSLETYYLIASNWRQMAMENTVSSDFCSALVDC